MTIHTTVCSRAGNHTHTKRGTQNGCPNFVGNTALRDVHPRPAP